MRTKKIAIALLVLGASLIGSPQALGAALPAWKLAVNSQPTNFTPGVKATSRWPEDIITATNIGGKSMTELVTTTGPAEGLHRLAVEMHLFWHSTKNGMRDLRQTHLHVPRPIDPGRIVQVLIPVEVELSRRLIVNEATIEGGGAPHRRRRPAPRSRQRPFLSASCRGAEGFSAPLSAETAARNNPGRRYHPYQLTVDLGFPTTASGGEFFTAAGAPKDIVVELPPGEIVNPSATPKCTEAQLDQQSGMPGEHPDRHGHGDY